MCEWISARGRLYNTKSDFRTIFRRELSDSVCIFTDASRSEASPFSGYALISQDGRYLRRYNSAGFVSSFCVEAMAVVEALELTRKEGWHAITVFSDSQSVLSAVQARFDTDSSSYLILRIKALVVELSEGGTEVGLWIPSHCGVVTSERMSLRGTRSDAVGTPVLGFRYMRSRICGSPK